MFGVRLKIGRFQCLLLFFCLFFLYFCVMLTTNEWNCVWNLYDVVYRSMCDGNVGLLLENKKIFGICLKHCLVVFAHRFAFPFELPQSFLDYFLVMPALATQPSVESMNDDDLREYLLQCFEGLRFCILWFLSLDANKKQSVEYIVNTFPPEFNDSGKCMRQCYVLVGRIIYVVLFATLLVELEKLTAAGLQDSTEDDIHPLPSLMSVDWSIHETQRVDLMEEGISRKVAHISLVGEGLNNEGHLTMKKTVCSLDLNGAEAVLAEFKCIRSALETIIDHPPNDA